MHAAVRFGFRLRMAVRARSGRAVASCEWVREQGGEVMFTASPKQAVENADLVVTDTWVDGRRGRKSATTNSHLTE